LGGGCLIGDMNELARESASKKARLAPGQRLGAAARSYEIALFFALWLFVSPQSTCADEVGVPAKASPLGGLSLAHLEQTRSRPLFSPARRPPAPPPAAIVYHEPDAPPPEPPAIVLLGVVTDAQGTHAIIKPSFSDKAHSIQIGDDISGWKAAEIEPRRLVLTRDTRSDTITLFEAQKPLPTKVAASNRPRR
jgi:hypothetical protein